MLTMRSVTGDTARQIADSIESHAGCGGQVSLHRAVALVFVLDCLVLVLAGLFPIWVQWIRSADGLVDMKVEAVVLALGLFLVCQKLIGSYRRRRILADGQSTRRTFVSLFVTFSLLMMLGAATKLTQDYSRLWFFSWMTVSLIGIPLLRWVVIAKLRNELAQGAYVYRALSIGVMCQPLGHEAIRNRSQGLSQVTRALRMPDPSELLVLDRMMRNTDIDEIYVTVPWQFAPQVFEVLNKLHHLSANIYVNAATEDHIMPFLGARVNDGELQLKVLDRPIEGWSSWQKRVLDLAIAYSTLIVFLPVIALVALAIKLESRGPLFFRQVRQGFNGRTFELLKFRSMYWDRSDKFAERQTSRGDDRVTRVGRLIRRTSLDELPQLINVLRGDMSIVGPRPHALKTTAEGHALDAAVQEYAVRHRVKPGMTGWAQVNGLRGELDSIDKLRRRVQHDVAYIENWSIGLDFKIILKTLLLVLSGHGAY